MQFNGSHHSCSRLRWVVVGDTPQASAFAEELRHSSYGELLAHFSSPLKSNQPLANASAEQCLYSDAYDDLLHDTTVDAIYIGTRQSQRAQLIQHAVANHKHVLALHPAFLNQRELCKVVSPELRKRLCIRHLSPYRHHPVAQALRELLGNEALGDLCALLWETNDGLSLGGQQALSVAAHEKYDILLSLLGSAVDLLEWLLPGSDWCSARFRDPYRHPERRGHNVQADGLSARDAWQTHGFACLLSQRSVSATLVLGQHHGLRNTLVAYGTGGRIEATSPLSLDEHLHVRLYYPEDDSPTFARSLEPPSYLFAREADAFAEQVFSLAGNYSHLFTDLRVSTRAVESVLWSVD